MSSQTGGVSSRAPLLGAIADDVTGATDLCSALRREGMEVVQTFGVVRELDLPEVDAVVECFRTPGRSFLMPPAGIPLEDDTVIDISHESLMRVWSRLRRWADEEAESAQQYLRVAAAAASFQAGQIGLWRDPELQLALQWMEEAQPTEPWACLYDPSFARAMVRSRQ